MPTKTVRQSSSSLPETGKSENPQRLSSTVTTPRKVIVTIGIDFGTSSTKIMFRVPETKATPHLCLFDGNPEGYPPVGLPSSVRVIAGKVYFGAEAEARSGGLAYRSFKTCLRCKLIKAHCIHCFDGRNANPGHRALPGGESYLPPEELATWYLAHVIAHINRRVRATHGADASLFYNMAAPMDVIQGVEGRNYYERALFLAQKLADVGVAEQGVDLESLRYNYHRVSDEFSQLPGEGFRNTFVVAETRAGVVSFTESRTVTSGLFALIDIGAGTTDMSIFRYMRDRDERNPYESLFYGAAVHAGGADRVDQIVLRHVAKQHPEAIGNARAEWLGRIRTAKQDGQIQSVVPVDVFKQASADVGRELFEAYRKVWFAAYEKEKRIGNWREMTMFLIGGGSSLPNIPEILATSPWRDVPPPKLLPLRLSDQIACDGSQSAVGVVDRHENLLFVAYGLCYPFADLEKYKMPSEVVPLPLPEPIWERPSSPDDYGKEGHWW